LTEVGPETRRLTRPVRRWPVPRWGRSCIAGHRHRGRWRPGPGWVASWPTPPTVYCRP